MSSNGYDVTLLNNYLQQRQQASLLTFAESSTGPTHDIVWTIECKIGGEVKGRGSAGQKSAAKDIAARQALAALKASE